MPIQQSKKQSDLEKRLRLIRRQVYGESSYSLSSEVKTSNPSTQTKSDTSYLYQDLLKIIIFSTFAIGAQLLLFFLSKNHVLNLNLF